MKRIGIIVCSTLIILLVVLAGCNVSSPLTSPAAPVAPAPNPSTGAISTPPPPIGSIGDIESTLENIYALVNPSVVSLRVPAEPTNYIYHAANSWFPVPWAFRPQVSEVTGSGFVWDSTGNIVTNNHVITDADNISVTFSDGTIVPAKLVGADPDSDLAVVKVNMPADQLKPVQMADSTSLKVGQLSIAIGNPFGLQNTMTVGFVSGLGRLLPASENPVGPSYSIPDVVQTDASINPGNSGGVLLDSTGKVIGVTSSIATTTGSSAGVGFAIPSAIVQQVVPALIKTGHYDHPYLGVAAVSLDPDLSTAMGLPANQRGALIESVTAGSPADKGGILGSEKPVTINGQQITVGGDVIIAYGNETVKSADDLVTLLARSGSVGQTVSLTVLRGGKPVQLQVTLGARPSSTP